MKKQLLLLIALFLATLMSWAQDWTAYNDCVHGGSPPNATIYSAYMGDGGGFETPSGFLRNYSTGAWLPVTATLTGSNLSGSISGAPASGTDAYNVFNGKVNLGDWSTSYNSSSTGWYYQVEFTGLDPAKTYEFVTTANRNSASYDGSGPSSRWTKFSITGADTYTNASTTGTIEVSADVVKMNTGYNTVNGFVVRWTNITPGADGSFIIRSENVGSNGPGEANKSYGMEGFYLAQTGDAQPSLPTPTTYISPVSNTVCGNYDFQVKVQDFINVGAISLVLNYDIAQLAYISMTPNTAISSIALEENTPGQLRMSYYSNTGVTLADDAVLLTLNFNLLPSAPGSTNLTWSTLEGDCEYAAPGLDGEVYASTFTDLTWIIPVRAVKNTDTGLEYCTIQAAINDPATNNNLGDLDDITVDALLYIAKEQVLVNKEVTITGINGKPIVEFLGTVTGKPTLFDVSANNVIVDNINFKVDLAKLKSAIIASAAGIDNITIKNNLIDCYGTPSSGTYGDRNAVSINYNGNTYYRVATGGVDNVIFTGNTVNSGTQGGFRSGISADEVGGTFSGNTLQSINHEILVRFAGNGDVTVTGNNLNGGGMEFSDFNAGAGTLTINGNQFNGAVANTYSNALRLKNNYTARPTIVSGNTFAGFVGNVAGYGGTLSLENYQAITLDGNSFTPPAGNTAYRHITLNTKDFSSSSGFYAPVVGATFTNNIFNGSGTLGGMALGFYNWDNDSPTFNAITIGTAGNENIFNENIGTFIYLDNSTGTVAPNATTMMPWAINLDAQNNKFALSPPILPSAMTFAQLFDLEDRITHKIDDQRLGFVLVKTNNAYVTDIASATAINNDYTRIRNAVDYVSDNWTINLHGTFDWIETNAAASWALGNDGIPGNDDDYTILVPAGLEGVTFTAPIGLGDARITGPGDLASVNLEGTLNFWLGNNRNWTISNMEIFDFDMAIGMFYVGSTDYNNTIITNNHIRIATDLNTTVAPVDVSQNIGIHYAFGTNQTISNNIIDIPGDGISNGTNYSSTAGIMCNTSGGSVYDGLQITGNIINILHAQSAFPEVILGIWENAHAHTSNITVNNNQFLNLHLDNNPALNLQRAYRITSHSGVSSNVTYSSNKAVGANMGFQWYVPSDYSAHQPISMTANTLTGNWIGLQIQGKGQVTLTNNFINGNLADGIRVTDPGSLVTINNNDLSGNGTWAINNLSAVNLSATCNWYGTNTVAGVAAKINGPVTYNPWLSDGSDIGDPGFVPGGTCSGATNLYVNDGVFDADDIYTTAIGSDSNPGTAAAPFLTITKAVNTAVDGTNIWVDAGIFQEQVSIGKTVDITGVDKTKTIVKAPVTLIPQPWHSGNANPIIYAYGNANTVNISKIAIDGDGGRTISNYVGVLYFEANGTFTNNKITAIRDAGNFSGVQAGIAFYGGHIRTATLAQNITFTYNVVEDFQKGGVVVDAPGTYGIIDNNVITGQNVALVTAQNGIQLSRGAYGSVQNNTISNCIWNKVEHPHQYTAAGILLYQAGASTVSGNTLSGNEVGLMSSGSLGITYSGDIYANNKIHLWLDAAGDVSGGNVYDKTVLNPAMPEVVFGCIQYAIDESTPAGGDILTASAGTFAENVVVHTPVSILGPKALVSGCDPSRGTGEAIVVPATDDKYGEIFHVAASNVTIKGFTIDGDNPALPTNGYGFGGADMHAAEGVTVYETGINNLNVTNNIFKNLLYYGVTLYDYPAGVPSSGHIISYNKFQDLGTYNPASTMEFWGGGVLLYNNQYTSVTNNCMVNVRIGIQTGNFWQPNPGASASQLITENTIEARRTGIFHNLHYSAASPITLSNNIINALANTNETKWDGIALSSLSVPSYSTNNTINGNGIVVTNFSKGYGIWNVKNTNPASINGGSVSGVDYGVFANNFEGYNSNGTDGAHAVIVNMSISPKTGGIGIYALYSPSYTGPATTINVQAYNNFITGGAEGVKLTENVAGTISAIANNNHITGNSGYGLNSTILNVVNATCNWWGTTDGNLIAPMINGNVNYVYWLENGTDDDLVAPGFQPVPGSCTGAPDFTGNYKYYNTAQTKMNNVTVELWKDNAKVYPVSGTVTTDGNGDFSFTNVLPDTYEVRASTVKPVGGINSSDAAQVNFWSVTQSAIEKVRFYAGDVSNNNTISSGDASWIQGYFLNMVANPFARSKWTFWTAGETISGNPGSGGYPTLIVPGIGSTVTQNFYALVTGDFNRSFTPGNLKSMSESLNLIYGEVIEIAPNTAFELPINAAIDMEVGAMSLIINVPADQLEVQGVYLTNNPSTPVNYSVTGDELRISWYSLTPLNLNDGDALLTLQLFATDLSGTDNIYLSLAADPLNELADGSYNVIENALISVNIIKATALGIGNPDLAGKLRFANYPNPFKGTTNFAFTVPTDGKVTLEVYNITGTSVMVMLDQVMAAGDHLVRMDAGALKPGVYMATLTLKDNDTMLRRTIKVIAY